MTLETSEPTGFATLTPKEELPFTAGQRVRYKGDASLLSDPRSIGRIGVVVDPQSFGGYTGLFWGRGTPPIDLMVEWEDCDYNASISERFCLTSSQRWELWKQSS